MFSNKNKEFKLLLEKDKSMYKDLEEQYLNLRKKYWELQEKYQEFDDIEDEYKDTIEKLAKELAYKTELLTLYHLKFGEDCIEIMERRYSRKKKNDDAEVIEL
ncbi:hypothetical protein QYB82_000141 [Clostridium perfringens]|nr:hypothetical protein [Clostridium perfringens]